MGKVVALLLVGVLSRPAFAADPVRVEADGPSLTQSTVATRPSALSDSVAREASRLARSTGSEPRKIQPIQPDPEDRGWIARHPRLIGALVGFGGGCVLGWSRVGGSQDTFFNALDEFACPAVGGIGAGLGALVGSLIK